MWGVAEQTKSQSLLEDSRGIAWLAMPRPLMWDSAGTSGDRVNAQGDLKVSVAKDGAGWKLTIKAARAWLNNRDRVYPVSVDPDLYQGARETHAYKTNGQYNHNYGIQAGNTSSDGTWRTMAQFNWASISGKHVLGTQIGFASQSSDSTATSQTGGMYKSWIGIASLRGSDWAAVWSIFLLLVQLPLHLKRRACGAIWYLLSSCSRWSSSGNP